MTTTAVRRTYTWLREYWLLALGWTLLCVSAGAGSMGLVSLLGRSWAALAAVPLPYVLIKLAEWALTPPGRW